MIFDDGQQRVELIHFGIAGDAFMAPEGRHPVFGGCLCPYNYMGDGHTGQWIQTLESVRALDDCLSGARTDRLKYSIIKLNTFVR